MTIYDNSLEGFIEAVRHDWGAISSEVVAACRGHMERLMRTPAAEEWLATLHREAPANSELHRDATHGFMLLAHTETQDLYRPPHDHGRGWVIYGIQQGELEIGTYARVAGPDGTPRLVKRDATILRAGEVRAYLPGDIHDTTCRSETALLFRFTERDLRREDREEGRVTRYIEGPGYWTTTR